MLNPGFTDPVAPRVRLGVALDFDGVLYDTYWFVPSLIAGEALRHSIDPYALLALEDVLEALGVWDRRPVYGLVGLPLLHEKIWASRVAQARPTGVTSILPLLRGLGLRLYIVCGADATREEKARRVTLYGVHHLVDDVIVYEPGGLGEALAGLVEREGLDALVYVDDKPGNTCIAAGVERVKPIHYRFEPPYPLRLAWRGAACAPSVSTPEELLDAILDSIGGSRPGNPSS